jgi:hypothetical protein
VATLRLYTCLNVIIPAPVSAADGQTNLWITAARRSDALRMLDERGIVYQEETLGGPVRQGPATAGIHRAGLADRPAVYAYPVPWAPSTPLMRVDAPTTSVPVTTMGNVLPHLVSR